MFVSRKVLLAFSTLVVAAFGIQSRIVGGIDAATGSAPWAGSIQVGLFSPTHICGGSIITTSYILTAGGCGQTVIGGWTGIVTQVVNFRVGSNYLSSGGTRYLISYGTVHPDFHPATGYANLAVLRTTFSISTSNLVYPIPLQTQTPSFQAPATVNGWGALSAGGLNSERLQSLDTYTISYSDCTFLSYVAAEAQGISVPAIYEQREICTFHSNGTGNCNGDQGNGLVSSDSFLIGVLSWAFPCGSGGPEVYSRVDFFLSWIQATIN